MGLRFGVYYSGGLDWSISTFPPHQTFAEVHDLRPVDPAYNAYALLHVRDLIERHDPAILWNDIDWPDAGKRTGAWSLHELFTDFGMEAFAERARLHQLACRTLAELAGIAERAGHTDTAIGHLSRLADIEPLDGDVLRKLVGALLGQGRFGEAVRRYKLAHAAFMDAFGEAPEFTVADLRRELRNARPAAASDQARSAATSLA